MANSNLDNITDVNNDDLSSETIIIETDKDLKNGQNKCPKCGATDISLNESTGKLRCNYCRYEFEREKISELNQDISKLKGQILSSGARNISSSTNDVITLKCSSCGAEVVIDTASFNQARCHWCRNILSINEQIPNGSVPDLVLPFKIEREVAKNQIKDFVKNRMFFADKKFKEEFKTENVMGVYFPYMIVDINSHSKLSGQGERLIRKYTRGIGDDAKTYYDAEVYNVEREFDVSINGLTVESSSDKLNNKASNKTNNVINAIMPFDIENCVRYDANYLKGYTSEKRDINVANLKNIVDTQARDIAKFSANKTLKEYNRGVRWEQQQVQINGQLWKTAYLPVWLYSYQQVSKDKKVIHYVAVNARTKEVMGSVPIDIPKLVMISSLIEIIGFLIFLFSDSDNNYNIFFILSGFIYFILIYIRYRNSNARHKYETETKTEIKNLKKNDIFLTRKNNLQNEMIEGANNMIVSDNNSTSILNSILNDDLVNNIFNDLNNK